MKKSVDSSILFRFSGFVVHKVITTGEADGNDLGLYVTKSKEE